MFFIFVCLWSAGLSQNIIYTNFVVKDGLASSTVYCTFQDSKGFMWFGTDRGVNRYDGSNFRTFTTENGLPDNEVFRMQEDSIGRLWLICYNSRPCFIQNGVVHNAENDFLLKGIDAEKGFFKDVMIDSLGRVWIYGPKLYVVNNYSAVNVKLPDNTSVEGVGYFNNRISILTNHAIYYVSLKNNVIDYEKFHSINAKANAHVVFGNIQYYLTQSTNESTILIRKSLSEIDSLHLIQKSISKIVSSFTRFDYTNSRLLLSCPDKGILSFNRNLQDMQRLYAFLPKDATYTYITFDSHGNAWISSLGEGVFFIPFENTLSYTLAEVKNSNVTSTFALKNSQLLLGFDHHTYGVLEKDSLKTFKVSDFDPSFTGKRFIRQCRFNNREIMVGTDYGLYSMTDDAPQKLKRISGECIKNIVNEGVDSILVAANTHAFRLSRNGSSFKMDTFWNVRTTAVAKDDRGRIWLGWLNGIFIWEQGKVTKFDKGGLINKSRISDMFADEYGNIWVATQQRGVFIIRKDTIISLNVQNGLPENMCVRFFKEGKGKLWICTSRHISQILYTSSDQSKLSLKVNTTKLPGSSECIVNDVFTDGSYIWLATSEGLLKTARSKTEFTSPLLYITTFKAGDSVFTDFRAITLPPRNSNIQIDFIGVSYNAGKTTYKYCISNSDTVFTSNTSVNLSSLSPGDYTFTVWSKSEQGEWNVIPSTVSFKILPPIWKTGWFSGLIALISGLIIWGVFRWRVYQIRIREKEKTSFNKKIAETQLQTLRAQINEHFIFNSLNAIQSFINQDKIESANFYLSSFGKLIRRTMDVSSLPIITLQEEIDYLENYLTLEKMRFDNKFNYALQNGINAASLSQIPFPSMILQPFVENAIRHGLRNRTDNQGVLRISFVMEKGLVVCSIEDNGIGREKANELKSMINSEHHSKGIELSENRVFLFNQAHNNKVRITIEDGTNGLGTVVKVFVPFKNEL